MNLPFIQSSDWAWRQPEFLWMAMVPLVAWAFNRFRRKRVLSLGCFGLLAHETRLRLRFIWLPGVLFVLAMLLLTGAVGDPVVSSRDPLKRKGIQILLCIDVSSSMLTADMDAGRSRLQVCKDAAAAFIRSRPDDHVGLIAFSRFADYLVLPTNDHEALQSVLSSLEASGASSGEDATAIGAAVALAGYRMPHQIDDTGTSQVVVLLTDGEENVATAGMNGQIAPVHGAQLCRKKGIRIHTIAAGSDVVSAGDVRGPLDTRDLENMASLTNGHFFRARDSEGIDDTYALIDALERREFVEPVFSTASFRPLLLVLSLACLLLSQALRWTLLRVLP